MATRTQHQQPHLGTGGAEVARAAPEHDGQPIAVRLTTEQVWHGAGAPGWCAVAGAGDPARNRQLPPDRARGRAPVPQEGNI